MESMKQWPIFYKIRMKRYWYSKIICNRQVHIGVNEGPVDVGSMEQGSICYQIRMYKGYVLKKLVASICKGQRRGY